jgi:recombination protein RecA
MAYNHPRKFKRRESKMDANKQKSLDLAIKQIDKAFGKGALMRLGDKEIEPIQSISTGSLGLDLALVLVGFHKVV